MAQLAKLRLLKSPVAEVAQTPRLLARRHRRKDGGWLLRTQTSRKVITFHLAIASARLGKKGEQVGQKTVLGKEYEVHFRRAVNMSHEFANAFKSPQYTQVFVPGAGTYEFYRMCERIPDHAHGSARLSHHHHGKEACSLRIPPDIVAWVTNCDDCLGQS